MSIKFSHTKENLLKELIAMETANPVEAITTPADLMPSLTQYAYEDQEHFIIIDLNGAHNVIELRVVSIGIANRCLVHPREIFKGAIINNATAVVLAHNHPSGSLNPSKEDDEITERIKKAGKIIGIEVLDHLIIGKKGYYSYLEEGKL